MANKVILVDKQDRKIGYEAVEKAHDGNGKHHRAFVTLLFDSQNRVLLQRRKHRRFDGLWDLTAISHPLKIDGKVESYQQASDRALKKEMRIKGASIDKIGAFNYWAKDGKNSENEYCAVLVGNYDGKFKSNHKEVYETKKIRLNQFFKDTLNNPKKYTPWAKEAVKILKNSQKTELNEEFSKFNEEFKNFSIDFFRKRQKFAKSYPKLISNFYKEIEDFSKGGKALRPFLVYLGYKIGGGKNIKKVLPLCLAFELVHSGFLIQDDIIDKSDVRRSKKTMHRRFEEKYGYHYGISQAMMASDIAFFEVLNLVNSLNLATRIKEEVIESLSQVLLETAFGEALDVEFSFGKAQVSDIWEMTKLKTANYTFVGPLTIGAKSAGASDKLIERLTDFGLSVGVAYQLKDDELGVFGDEEMLGKSVLSDLREGKNTVLFYKAYEMANDKQRAVLNKLWGKEDSDEKDLEKVRKIFLNSGAVEWVKKEMKIRIKKAKGIFEESEVKKELSILKQLADFVIDRQK